MTGMTADAGVVEALTVVLCPVSAAAVQKRCE